MTCRHCQALNADSDHRCSRCGRRLQINAAWAAPDTYPIITATAPAFETISLETVTLAEAAPETSPSAPTKRRVEYQKPLFPELNRVVAMPAAMPAASPSMPAAPSQPRRPRAPRPAHPDQRHLFDATPINQAVPVIFCDAPVATPQHRIAAAVADLSLVLVAFGAFVATFRFAAGELVPSAEPKLVLALYAGVLGMLWLFYHAFFCACNVETPGMRWFQLRLLNFDGHAPSRDQRWQRLAGSVLSIASAGLGLVWTLVDEEKLGWQDHISKTFPTPDGLQDSL